MDVIRRLIIGSAATLVASLSFADAPVVKAPIGHIEGRSEGALRVFKGIRYALPPTGPMRWKPPRPTPPWSGVFKAAQFGPACIQPVSPPGSIYADDPP